MPRLGSCRAISTNGSEVTTRTGRIKAAGVAASRRCKHSLTPSPLRGKKRSLPDHHQQRTGHLQKGTVCKIKYKLLHVSVNLDRPHNRAGADRGFVIVKANQAGLRHGSRQSVESIEPAAIGNELRPLLLEHLPNGVLGTFRMWMSLGIGDDLIGEPSIQLVIGLELQSRREEALANETHLVLDLTLLPARCRRAGDGLHQMMGAHLQEPPIILPVLADEDRLHRGLHIIIDATCAGAFKKGEGPLVGVEHHLLRLAGIGADKHHAAVAETDVRDLHDRRSELSLAIVIGEATVQHADGTVWSIEDYPNVRMLWKRLGLAPYNGRAMSTWRMANKTIEKLST